MYRSESSNYSFCSYVSRAVDRDVNSAGLSQGGQYLNIYSVAHLNIIRIYFSEAQLLQFSVVFYGLEQNNTMQIKVIVLVSLTFREYVKRIYDVKHALRIYKMFPVRNMYTTVISIQILNFM